MTVFKSIMIRSRHWIILKVSKFDRKRRITETELWSIYIKILHVHWFNTYMYDNSQDHLQSIIVFSSRKHSATAEFIILHNKQLVIVYSEVNNITYKVSSINLLFVHYITSFAVARHQA